MKLIEKTPQFMTCLVGSCPAVFETDRDTYVVIGKKISPQEVAELLNGRVGGNETAIEFPKALFIDILDKNS